MFDGKSLSGWKQVGGTAKYRVEGDQIIGTVDPATKANSFLRTDKTYGDFILRLDLKLDIPGKLGHPVPQPRAGREERLDSRLRLPSRGRPLASSLVRRPLRRGSTRLAPGLEGSSRGPEGHSSSRTGTPTRLRPEGRALKITLNGVPCVDYLDTADLEGFIALQVHTGKEGPDPLEKRPDQGSGPLDLETPLRRQEPGRLGLERRRTMVGWQMV